MAIVDGHDDQPALPRAVHVIPYDAIGGVESAAASCPAGKYPGFIFSRLYLVKKRDQTREAYVIHGPSVAESDPRAYTHALKCLLQIKPRLVIASLWRSCLVLLAYKALRPRTPVVTFLHSAVDAHWLDKIANRMAMAWSSEIWADSHATLESRVPSKLRGRAHVISFMIERQPEPRCSNPQPNFIFWGRLAPEKNLIAALHFFARIHSRFPKAIYRIVGPDMGERELLLREAVRLGLDGAVVFPGPMNHAQLFELARSSSFYLQTSIREGMAMSVLEAMQLGLVPVVTPVGEIPRYCREGENGILIGDERETADRVCELLVDPSRFQSLAHAAWSTWQAQSLYREDMLEGCRRILNGVRA